MEVNEAMVERLAHLSRLSFEPGEKKEIANDLQKMITFIEKLQEVDTEGVEPLLFMSDSENVFRQDEIKGSVSREEGLKNAPAKNDSFFMVPKVIKK
jgi:aspartyl-tRNA(Asn)/glutamyl-tRNA(Gln) amidotransferase subunit C